MDIKDFTSKFTKDDAKNNFKHEFLYYKEYMDYDSFEEYIDNIEFIKIKDENGEITNKFILSMIDRDGVSNDDFVKASDGDYIVRNKETSVFSFFDSISDEFSIDILDDRFVSKNPYNILVMMYSWDIDNGHLY